MNPCCYIGPNLVACLAGAVTQCKICKDGLCWAHSHPTRLGRLCGNCMRENNTPILPTPGVRTRVPDSPNGGTRLAEVRPLGVFRTARVITMPKLLTAGGAYLETGGAIVEIEGAGEIALTKEQYEALFEEI